MPVYAAERSWVLETQSTGYAFGLNSAGLLAHRYWGPRLAGPADYPEPAEPGIWGAFNNPAQLTTSPSSSGT